MDNMKNKNQREFINILLAKIEKNDKFKKFLNRIEEFEEIRIKRTAVGETAIGEYDIMVKGRYWIYCTSEIIEETIIYNTSTGLISWTTDRYEQ